MTGYIIKRILAMIPVLLIVGLFAFSIMHLAKGDPAILLAGGQEATPDYIEKIRENLGLNRPLLVQLWDWFWGVIRGDFGESYVGRKDVMSLIVPRLLPTLSLAAFTEIFAVVFGIPLGVVAAWKAGSWIDRAVMALSTVGFSAPLFFLGFVLMIIFGVKLEWLPVAGYVAPTQDFSAFISRMVMPTLATGLVVMSWIARMTRATVLETLNEDYIRTARAKGLTENVVLIRHALRNAILPIVTVIGMVFAGLLGGVVVVESVFAIPGLGRLMVNAIQNRDLPLIQGVIMLSAVFISFMSLVVDVAYAYLDPRIRY